MPFSSNAEIYRYIPLPPSSVGEDDQRRLDQEMRNLRRTLDSQAQLIEEMRTYLENQTV